MADPPSYPPPPEDVQEIAAPEQYAALAHPLRQRLLSALGRRPATISQLALRLEARKGNVAHHLKVLREAGLVHVAETRRVRGGTEQYYQRTARRILVAESQPGDTNALFGAIAEELNRSPAETHLVLRHLHLSPAKAERLREMLIGLVDETEDDGEEQAPYGVLVAMYEQARPTGPESA